MHIYAHTCIHACIFACMYTCMRLYMYPAEASNPSGGHCCQTYWGLFLRQPEGGGGGGRGGGGERGDGGRWSGGWFEGGWASEKGEGEGG